MQIVVKYQVSHWNIRLTDNLFFMEEQNIGQKLCLRNIWKQSTILHKDFCIIPPPPFFLHWDVRDWTKTLNQSPGHTMFQYQTFHMTLLTLSFYALLHPDSIKNELTALFQDWRPFCCWALCSTLWLMGSPRGLLEVSLKVWNSEMVCLRMHTGNRYFSVF